MNRAPRVGRGLLAALLVAVGTAIPAGVSLARGPLVYGGDHDYPPYEYLNERGEPAGFNVDLARHLGELVEIRLGPWAEIVRQFEVEKSIDFTDMFYTAERARRVAYTEAFAVMYDEIFVRSDTPHGCVFGLPAGSSRPAAVCRTFSSSRAKPEMVMSGALRSCEMV